MSMSHFLCNVIDITVMYCIYQVQIQAVVHPACAPLKKSKRKREREERTFIKRVWLLITVETVLDSKIFFVQFLAVVRIFKI